MVRKIEIYWMRHGQSCSNSLDASARSFLEKYTTQFVKSKHSPDAHLNNIGILQAQEAREAVKSIQADVVMSSFMSRALETALCATTTEEIHVVPHINETSYPFAFLYGGGQSSISSPLSEQKRQHPSPRLNWTMVEGIEIQDASPNYYAFINLIHQWVEDSPHLREKETVKFLVVSHGNFIRYSLTAQFGTIPHPDNTEIIRQCLEIKKGSCNIKNLEKIYTLPERLQPTNDIGEVERCGYQVIKLIKERN